MANVKATDLIEYTRASKGHALAKVSYGSELVENGDFELGDNGDWGVNTNWTISGGVATLVGGDGVYGNSGLYQLMDLDVGKIYRVSLDISGLTGTLRLYHEAYSTGVTLDSEGTVVFNLVGGAGGTRLNILGNNGSAVTLDNISVKEVTFNQANGTLQLFEHPNNIPRIEYDADGNLLGLLIEESRTNLVTYSEDFLQWNSVNTSLTQSAIESPDGATTATKLIATTADGQHRRDYLSTYSAGTYTFSVFAKVGGYNYLELRLGGDGVYVDIRDGSLAGASVGITTSYEDVGNGWKRIAITHSAGANDTARINVLETSGQRSFAGDGTSGIYIWGAQLEAGSFPTSYIKTTGSTATRSADVASIDVDQFGYNQSEGTLLVEASNISANAFGAYLSDGTSSERMFVYINTGYQFLVVDGGSTVAQIDAGNLESGVNKISASYKLNDSSVSLNGGSVVTDTSCTIPTVTTMNIGSDFNGNTSKAGHIKSIKYFPKRLSNAKLQELTS